MTFEKETGRDLYFKQLDLELAELVDPATGRISAAVSRFVDCPLCASARHSEIFVKRGYPFVRCHDCGLVFANPQVVPDVVEKTYRHQTSSTELWMKVLLNEKEKSWRGGYFAEIVHGLQRRISKGSLLDVGCAVGQLLEVARAEGWKVAGLELNQTAVRHCLERGLDVRPQMLDEAAFGEGEFDAVTLMGVLEHVPLPKTLLKECRHVIRSQGVIAIVVPNLYSFANFFLREKNVTFDGRNHLVYFCRETLYRVLAQAGFVDIEIDTILTGLDNISRYIQFYDPYGDVKSLDFVPTAVKSFFEKSAERDQLEKWIITNGLGLRLRAFARVP